tara:strand:+ start:422 stop:634 length:213 start_codon:yes stop_codon:yes gene_type:complete
MLVIFKKNAEGISLSSPSSEYKGTIDEYAKKIVPTGLKYKIVEDSDIPSDRTFRNAWEIADSELTDGVGA